MKPSFWKERLIPHLGALLVFLTITFAYFTPQLEGKKLLQHDKKTWLGMSKELNDYKQETGETALWTNSMFGGMPSFLINNPSGKNLMVHVHKALNLFNARPAAHIFLYMIGFYILLMAFGVNPWLSIIGALAYAFSSYFLIIIAAGHITKVMALGYMPAIIGGIWLTFNGKRWLGATIMALFLSLQLICNHLQITYYTLLVVICFGIVYLFQAFKERKQKEFFLSVGTLVVGALLAIGTNMTSLATTYEYGNYSIRGKSELTRNQDNKTSGLDKDYATAWSYGVGETFTLLIPDFHGGVSEPLDRSSQTFKRLQGGGGTQYINYTTKYWGSQPFTSGPVYIGAFICFLFFLGLYLVKGPLKWWVVLATLLSLFLSWGKNMPWLTNFFLDYVPGYNKFRTVSMTLVIAQMMMPLLGIFALNKVLNREVDKADFKRAFLWSLGLTGGLTLLFAMIPSLAGDFIRPGEEQFGPQIVKTLQIDRQGLLKADAFRSLLFILAGAGILWFSFHEKIGKKLALLLLGGVILFDLWGVDRRYLNDENFVSKEQTRVPYKASKADQYILKDKEKDFRVLNLTVSTFNDASTSYFHKSIGGYHGAKMRRYQELIEYYISPEIQALTGVAKQAKSYGEVEEGLVNTSVLNMLNLKYVIFNPNGAPIENPYRMGNAWLVPRVRFVENADEEIEALKNLNPKVEALVDKRFKEVVPSTSFEKDTMASIVLKEYNPNKLVYHFKGATSQLAVFSEIYYPKGWIVEINGEPQEYFRSNYVLRSMVLKPGDYDIVFRFQPKSYTIGSWISLFSSLLLIGLILGIIIFEIRKR